MKKLFSLVAMMFCVIAGWAQSMLETPTYYQIPASPYVFETTPENVKGGYFQKWICTDAGSWQTVAASATVWYGRWENLNEATPTWKANPTYINEPENYGFDGMQVRDQTGTGRRLYMFVQKVSSIEGFFVANTQKNDVNFVIRVYDGEELVAEKTETAAQGGDFKATVKIDGLDNTKSYKVLLASDKGNAWVQAVKFEGTPSNVAKHGSHVYLEQVGTKLTAKNLAEGETLHYVMAEGDDAISGAATADSPQFPENGLFITPNKTLKLRLRAFDRNLTPSPTWNVTYEINVPEITDDYVAILSISDVTITNEATGDWKTSVAYNEWNKVYTNTDKVLWTTTAGDYQFIGKAQEDFVVRKNLNGEDVEIPGVTWNRNNTLYFMVTEPSVVKLTAAPMYKNGSQVKQGSANVGNVFEIDGEQYNLNGNWTYAKVVEAGLHTFTIPNKPEVGFQMLEIKKGTEIPAVPEYLVLNPEPGTDIAEALTAAKAGVEAIDKVVIGLKEGEYTVGATLETPASIAINGKGAKINASALEAPFVTLNGTTKAATQIDAVAEDGTLTTSESTSFKYIKDVKINGVNITGLKKALVRDEQKTLVENVLVDNSNIEVVGSASIIDFASKGYPAALKVANSTLWSKEGHSGFFAQLQNRLGDVDKTKSVYKESIEIENSTLYNISYDKKMNNLNQKGQTWLTFVLKNSIFYNVSTADPLNGWNGGQDSASPTMVYENNTYWSTEGAVAVWIDETKNTSDKTGTAIQEDPKFADAANGDFTLSDVSLQAKFKTGDPRWLVEYDEEKATSIDNATVNTTVNGAVYNLAGQKVSSNFKGIVIMNGKKVMVK